MKWRAWMFADGNVTSIHTLMRWLLGPFTTISLLILVTSIGLGQIEDAPYPSNPLEVAPFAYSIVSNDSVCSLLNGGLPKARIIDNLLYYEESQESQFGRETIVLMHHRGTWFSVDLAYSMSDIQLYLTGADSSNAELLTIIEHDRIYGNAGGTTTTSVVILRIDTAVTRVCYAWIGEEEESFGRHGNGYDDECHQEVIPLGTLIEFLPMTSKSESGYTKREYELQCKESVPPGVYALRNGSLRKIADYPATNRTRRKSKPGAAKKP